MRERGDAVTEARAVAAHTRNQAARLLDDTEPAPPGTHPRG
ncbi:hypothetical protein SZN_03027 [Streptomyces zinciresistens K42]|uniref:Uncharacterized protein n=1 Tax=Streptomyces zinciresistens K42 TaxID=700597 RepID=G2G552_9ACTN|nr:hypothetical protein [Streptomyces zinciresistens]EGX61490.1 hypothetical protein SZN_03027 [Streptomyces zinciresistens K42]